MSTLEKVKGVGPTTAEKLRKAGFDSVPALAEADYEAVAEQTGLSPSVVQRLVDASGVAVEEIEVENLHKEIGEKGSAMASEILKMDDSNGKASTFREELFAQVMQRPDIRERVLKEVVNELFD